MFVVLKAERVSNDSLSKGYKFPDKDDNLSTEYTGSSAQLSVSTDLLHNLSKLNCFVFHNKFLCTCSYIDNIFINYDMHINFVKCKDIISVHELLHTPKSLQ